MKKLRLGIAFLVLGSVMAVERVGNAQVASPPGVSKAFGAATIPLSGTTSLSLVIVNPNVVSLTGVGFTDNLPAGLIVATPNGLFNNCGGTATATAGSNTISLSGGTMGAGFVLCDVKVNVTGTTAGVKNNSVTVTSSNGTGNTAAASITVVAPPTISKGFGAETIPLNRTASLTVVIQNTNDDVPLTNVAFTDNMPAGLVVDTQTFNSCGGTLTATSGSSTISLSGATLASGRASICGVIVYVIGTTAGIKNNTTDPVTSTESGAGGTAIASITVVAPTPTSTPTSTPTPVPVVPTLNESGMLIFGLLIAAAGLLLLIRRS